MLYLKNTLGGLGRSLHDSALNTFQGPNRWWKLALYVVMFVLPGDRSGSCSSRGSTTAAMPASLRRSVRHPLVQHRC